MEEDGEGDLPRIEGVIAVDGEQRLLNSSSHSTTPFGPTRSFRVLFLLTVRLSELSAIFGPFHLTSATTTAVVFTLFGHGSRSIIRMISYTSNFRDSNGSHGRHLIILAIIRSSLFFHLSGFFFRKAKKALRPPLLPFLFFSFIFFLPCFFFLLSVLHCDGGTVGRTPPDATPVPMEAAARGSGPASRQAYRRAQTNTREPVWLLC